MAHQLDNAFEDGKNAVQCSCRAFIQQVRMGTKRHSRKHGLVCVEAGHSHQHTHPPSAMRQGQSWARAHTLTTMQQAQAWPAASPAS